MSPPPLGDGPVPGNGVPPFDNERNPPINDNQSNISSGSLQRVKAYYCQPLVLDLFVEEHRFDCKGFKMIAHIDQHFNPLGAVDS
jgi:hypothetical protein